MFPRSGSRRAPSAGPHPPPSTDPISIRRVNMDESPCRSIPFPSTSEHAPGIGCGEAPSGTGQSVCFPQQLPGPAQPEWDGEAPQQEVSPGPGSPRLAAPDRDDGAESSLVRFALPQDLQVGSSSEDAISTSLVAPHSAQWNSNIGMFSDLIALDWFSRHIRPVPCKRSSPPVRCSGSSGPGYSPEDGRHLHR